jgi:diguanylate cyclase (GGDEF)-like protein
MASSFLDSSERIRELREAYTSQLASKYERLEATLTDFVNDQDVTHLRELGRQAHKLAGSAGSYGYFEVSRLGALMDVAVSDLISGEQGDLSALHRLLGLLRDELRTVGQVIPSATARVPAASAAARGLTRVALLEDDVDTATLLTEQLLPFGFSLQCHETPEALHRALDAERPSALIVDVELRQGVRGTTVAAELSPELRDVVPVVVLSTHDDLDSRLEAVRAGAEAYLTKPVNVDELVELLDRLTASTHQEVYRVLVIDDSRSTSQLYAAALEEGGMITRIANSAREAMRVLLDFSPEIILLDLYMPEISGVELAQVIRQYPSLLAIPIVFISAEADEAVQTRALGRGGDGFLTKPLDLATLTDQVRIRAQRYRQLRDSMQRDSLTGLLNHRNAKEFLDAEVSRAQRSNSPVTVAMLDIDHFKIINDTHGHPEGDRVIKSLARILTQRLRRSDIIGRYGGEEFIVIMPDTGVRQAVSVLDAVRDSFSTVSHQAGTESFTCSLSGGVVEASATESGSEVIARADEALYEAKRSGRNRIISG